ncbi:MAG: GAF domain-containing protein [Acidimicrobiales bacterium]
MSAHDTPFTLLFGLDGDHATVSVQGDVDLKTAPMLAGLLRVAAQQPEGELALDLGELGFLDASGLRAIAEISQHLQASGRTLTLRSTPPLTRRLLEISRIGELVHLETVEPAAALGIEERTADSSHRVGSASPDTAAQLVSARIGPADHAVVDAALRLVTALADTTVGGADGVSVTLRRHDRLSTVAATNDVVQRMDDHQYRTSEGPCLAAAAEGRWFHIQSLAREERWPVFVPLAREEGVASVLSTPLMIDERPVGALNIYSNTEGVFGGEEQELAALFATQASAILGEARTDVTEAQIQMQLAGALEAREVIAQAQGVLMGRDALDPDGAAAVLHRAARADEVTVLQVAQRIVTSTVANASEDGSAHG